jgi:3-isopropylmalate dehydrogenase
MKIAALPGDGIGPEIMAEALKVLDYFAREEGLSLEIEVAPLGAQAYFDLGDPFPPRTKSVCDSADVILKGPVGLSHAETQKIPLEFRPERGAILPLRKRYDTFANYRPVRLSGAMKQFSPLKNTLLKEGVDFVIVRELVGGLYFGEKSAGINHDGLRYVRETLEYDEAQIRRILVAAFNLALGRKKHLHNIHKSNVLLSSVLWNEVLSEVEADYPDVRVTHLLVDAAATAMCLEPTQFDVMVMENMFGDILSDQAGGILGSLGLMPSACVGEKKSYFEPSHGSAPDLGGLNVANPYSMIGSVALMLEMSMGRQDLAGRVWSALFQVLENGCVTQDLSRHVPNAKVITTSEFGSLVLDELA